MSVQQRAFDWESLQVMQDGQGIVDIKAIDWSDTYGVTPVVFPYTERRKVERHVKPPSGMMLRGVRDGYAFREQSESRTTVTADCYAHVATGSPPYVGVGFYERLGGREVVGSSEEIAGRLVPVVVYAWPPVGRG